MILAALFVAMTVSSARAQATPPPATNVGAAPDCAACGRIAAEIRQLHDEEAAAKDKLAQNKELARTLPAEGAASKKIKLVSNILIFSSKVETMGNNIALKERDLTEKRCISCPRK